MYSKRDCKKRCAKRGRGVERVRFRRDERRERRRRKMIYNAGKIDREGRKMRTESAMQKNLLKRENRHSPFTGLKRDIVTDFYNSRFLENV